jgi:hypothetical protein
MKVTFRIREEITRKNGQKISWFYCEEKILWWWQGVFYSRYRDGSRGPEIGFHTKQAARMAILNHYQTPEVRYH